MTISENNVKKNNAKITPKIPVILASKSFIRQKMLVATGLEFTVKPADIDERALQKTIQDNSVEEHVRQLANAKAKVKSKAPKKDKEPAPPDVCVDFWAMGNART